MTISHLVAASENNVIGKGNEIPWHLPNDFKYFKNLTWGMPVIMGRKTFESMGKMLPGRFNIVITRQQDWKEEGVIVASSLEDAIEKAKETDCKELFIIGGGEIFKQSMDIADRLYITRVHTTINGDVFYPEINSSQWKLISEDPQPADEKHKYAYTFQTWERQNH
jgi:dihydrofolate reductase